MWTPPNSCHQWNKTAITVLSHHPPKCSGGSSKSLTLTNKFVSHSMNQNHQGNFFQTKSFQVSGAESCIFRRWIRVSLAPPYAINIISSFNIPSLLSLSTLQIVVKPGKRKSLRQARGSFPQHVCWSWTWMQCVHLSALGSWLLIQISNIYIHCNHPRIDPSKKNKAHTSPHLQLRCAHREV